MEPRGLRIRGKPTFEQWKELLRTWREASDKFHFGLADLLVYGNEHFGKARVDQVVQQMEFDVADAIRAMSIGQIPLDLRSENLSSEHYFVMARANLSVKEQGRWAAIATKENLTALELQKSIAAGHVVKAEVSSGESGRNSGIATIQGMRFWFERWSSKVGGRDAVLAWDRDTRAAWLSEVRPVVDLAREVENSLKQEQA